MKPTKILLLFCILTSNFKLGTLNCLAQNNRLWATYYGGADWERGSSIVTDTSGNVYMAGLTDFYAGSGEAFLTKFDISGNLLWSEYYGGAGIDASRGIAIDAAGYIYISGATESNTGIASGGFQNSYGGGTADAFLMKFDASGTRLWATYYGGTGTDGDTDVEGKNIGVATDVTGNIYLSGYTDSPEGIAFSGFQNTLAAGYDAYLVKFDALGNRLWATYYGGTGDDKGFGVATDALGNVYLSGITTSTTSIASGGFQNLYGGGGALLGDAFLVKFDSSGNRLWATYYGGTGEDGGYGVAIDKTTSNVYLAGVTTSIVGIASGGFQNIFGGGADSYLVKFDSSGNRIWATYYGGTWGEEMQGLDVATDIAGNVYLAGDTYSSNTANCIASGGFQNSLMGPEDGFIAKFDSEGNRLCSTYYGLRQEQDMEDVNITLDRDGNVYIAGFTLSTDDILDGNFDAYLAKFSSCFSSLNIAVSSSDALCNGQCNGIGTATATSTGSSHSYTYNWSNGKTTQTITGLCAGTYTVIVTDEFNATTTAVITIAQPAVLSNSIVSTDITCHGGNNGSATIVTSGGSGPYNYQWSNSQTNATTTGLSIGSYTVITTDDNSCSSQQNVIITDPPAISASLSATPYNCENSKGTANTLASGGTFPLSYQWSNGATTPQISNLTSQIYSVTVTDVNGCSTSENIHVNSNSTSINISPDVTIVLGESTTFSISGGVSYEWTPSTSLSCTTCADPVANPVVTTIYHVTSTDENGCTRENSVTVFILENSLFIPNVFTPNGDGKNDIFQITANGYKSYQLQIFNRWGEKVFETNTGTIQWDGSPEQPDGTYYYILGLIDFKEKYGTYKGFVTLLR